MLIVFAKMMPLSKLRFAIYTFKTEPSLVAIIFEK